MTEYRDAYPCAIDGWCKVPDGAYTRLYEPGRPYQYRIVKDPQPNLASTRPIPDVEEALREEQRALGRRAIPRRNADPDQGVLL